MYLVERTTYYIDLSGFESFSVKGVVGIFDNVSIVKEIVREEKTNFRRCKHRMADLKASKMNDGGYLVSYSEYNSMGDEVGNYFITLTPVKINERIR